MPDKNHPPLLDVHVPADTEVHSVLSYDNPETVHSEQPQYVASQRSSTSRRSVASFRSVDVIPLKPCTNYSQYSSWIYGQFSNFLPKGVQYLVGTILKINSVHKESTYRLMPPEGFIDVLGPTLYDEHRAALTELSMIWTFLNEHVLPCPFTAYLVFRANNYEVYGAEFIHSDFFVTENPTKDDPVKEDKEERSVKTQGTVASSKKPKDDTTVASKRTISSKQSKASSVQTPDTAPSIVSSRKSKSSSRNSRASSQNKGSDTIVSQPPPYKEKR